LPRLQLLERGAGKIQIGLDPRHAVVASGLPRGVIDALRALDGRRNVDTLLALADREHAGQLRGILSGLTERGLVSEANTPAHSTDGSAVESGLWSLRSGQDHDRTRARLAHCAVVVRGDGRLAIALATLLAKADVGHIEVAASGKVTEQNLGCGYTDADVGQPRRKAAAEAVRAVNPATRTSRLVGDRQPELVLLTDAVVPAPEVVSLLVHDGIPHLTARVRDGIGIVGPLVIPGRSSGLNCADLHRTALDSRWLLIAGQLAGLPQRADVGDVLACAALAAAQALRALSPDEIRRRCGNATLEIDSYDGAVRRRWWPAHPRCGSGAR
jgi:hypothetical protein